MSLTSALSFTDTPNIAASTTEHSVNIGQTEQHQTTRLQFGLSAKIDEHCIVLSNLEILIAFFGRFLPVMARILERSSAAFSNILLYHKRPQGLVWAAGMY